MIIDLSGLPASGKSFFSKQFSNASRKKDNKKFINFIEWDRTTLLGRACHTLAYPIIRHTNKYKRLSSIMANYVTNNPQYNESHTVDFFVTRIIFLKLVYSIAEYTHINLLVNEGISQSLIIFAIEFELQENEFIGLVSKVLRFNKVKYAVYQISLSNCMISFVHRNRHATQIDELRDDDLYEFLLKFEIYLNVYLNTFKFIPLDRENEFENNFKLLRKER